MEDFSKDAVILTAFENKEALGLLTCDLVRRGVGLVLLIDDSSGSAAGSSAIPGLTILRQTPDRDDAPTLRDALQYLNLHRPDMEYAAVLESAGDCSAENIAGLLAAVHGRKRLLAVSLRRPGRGVSFLSWRRNRLNCLLPRLVSGEGEAESLRSSRAFSTQLIPQFLTVEGEGQAYHLNCLLSCISTGIALEEVLFPVKEEKTEYRIPEFLKSIIPG